MATSKQLQIPEIIGLVGSTLIIKHPDTTKYNQTSLTAEIGAGGTSMSVKDQTGFADDDWFVLGAIGRSKAEECDVNGTVTKGSAITITNTLKFSHGLDEPVVHIKERGIKIYGALTDGGVGTLIASIDAITATTNQLADAKMIDWAKPNTQYTLISTDTAYTYYFCKFTDGVTDSSASDYVLATGISTDSVSYVINRSLEITNSVIGELISWDYMVQSVQDCQREITQWIYTNEFGKRIKKDWGFEIYEDNTSLVALEMENRYALSSLVYEPKTVEAPDSFISIFFGNKQLKKMSVQDYLDSQEEVVRDELSSGVIAGATSITLKDSSLFTATNGTIRIGGDTITYTTNNKTTGVLSGIPSSGTGSISQIYLADRAVYQNEQSGLPTHYTVFNNQIYLNVPVSSTYASYKLKCKFYRKLPALTQASDAILIPFTNVFQDYLAYKIYLRKADPTNAAITRDRWKKHVDMNALGDKVPTLNTYSYYNYIPNDEWDSRVVINAID